MNKVKSLMGRRQFLIAAGATSTAALGYKKFAGALNPDSQRNIAIASENSGTSDLKGGYSDRYSHLISPIKIRNVVIKNRMMQTASFPRILHGPETFPTDQIIHHYTNVAKNGCAVCLIDDKTEPLKPLEERTKTGHGAHQVYWNIDDVSVQHYLAQMADAIHFYGSKACVGLRIDSPDEYNISGMKIERGGKILLQKELTEEMIQGIIEESVNKAKVYQSCGFDMVSYHMSYHNNLLAFALSPVLNKRTDKYGGSLEKRARLALDLFQAIKKACGQDFLISANISGEEIIDNVFNVILSDEELTGGYTVKDMIEYAKVWQDDLDILVVRGDEQASHPSGFDLDRKNPPILRYAEAVKKSDAKIIVAPSGGFQDLDLNEGFIASGKCDMIAMARPWFADPEYGKKAYEGRGEDVIPCVLCSECHGSNGPPWVLYCTVNPKFGISHKDKRMIDAPTVSRKVAVIGGGPAGMKAAITAAERGHRVTLYERTESLGGQLRFTDYVSFKWPLRELKDYLIRQVKKMGVDVNLMTSATPEMIKAKGYDAVIVALGADPIIPDLPGAKAKNVIAPIFAYGNKTLGKKVVVIGGDQIGTETGMHLAEEGHEVTVMTTEKDIATDMSEFIIWDARAAWEALEEKGSFGYITEAAATGITTGGVTYIDAKGDKKSIQADSVVIYAGRRPRQEEAMKFSGSAKRFFIVGDCSVHGDVRDHWKGNVRHSIRSGFAAASEL